MSKTHKADETGAPAPTVAPVVTQLCAVQEHGRAGLYALCADGTIWFSAGGSWSLMPGPGQPEPPVEPPPE
jgi:hypothetical protein